MEHSKNVHSFWEFQVLVGFVVFFLKWRWKYLIIQKQKELKESVN